MVIIVPFDNSPLAKAALKRTDELMRPLEPVIAVAVIPKDNHQYARDRGWLEADEEFDPERIISRLANTVNEILPSARFEYLVVDRYASTGQIGRRLRTYAREHDARLVVIGSNNAGRITTNLGSIGSTVATDMAYDVLIVRHLEAEEHSG